MTINANIVALGTASHGDYVRLIAGDTDCAVHASETVFDAISLIKEKSCDVVIAELPLGDLDSDEFLVQLRETSPDCLAIFRLPSTCVGEAVSLARSGAYACLDEQMSPDESLGDSGPRN